MRTRVADRPLFQRLAAIGTITIEPLVPERDIADVHAWLAHPASEFWHMGDLHVNEVRDYLAGVVADDWQDAWLGRVDGTPTFLVESYDPARVLLTGLYAHERGDIGMHLLVAPLTAEHRSGLTSAVMRSVVTFLLETLGARRVVVEPDELNQKVAAKNDEVGFRVVDVIDLPGKRANLSVLTLSDLRAAHLAPGPMGGAHRALMAKALSEFAHERMIHPTALGDGRFHFTPDDGTVEYTFTARVHMLEHWVIDEQSIQREIRGVRSDLDAAAFIIECQARIGLPDALLGTYLEEISSTLASAAYKRLVSGPTAAQLTTADFQTIERSMTEGHPAFVANNGRIGFTVDDFHDFTPETGAPIRLVWLAARRAHAHLALGVGLTEEDLYVGELGAETIEQFASTLTGHGLDPGDYRYLPVHPYQWNSRLAITFAPDLARRDLVLLGEGTDVYQAQQSIRTSFNRSWPEKYYVKTALAIQNMGFLRGLSPAYMQSTPAINDWVHELVTGDRTLREGGFEILRERATIGWTGDVYHRHAAPSAYRKMVAALWRESPVGRSLPA